LSELLAADITVFIAV